MQNNSRTLSLVFVFAALISASAVVVAALIVSKTTQPAITQVIPITQIVQVTQVLPVIHQLEVYADMGWQDTGIEVNESDNIDIQYISGRWHLWPGEDTYDGSGFGGDPTCDCNVLKYISHGGLIGRIGNGKPFYVGNRYSAMVFEIGKLYLRINDTVLYDNSGSITVNIAVKR